MAIRILIVEDSESTGSLLTDYLVNHLASVANEEGFPPAHGGVAGDWSGHLGQLRPFKWQYEHTDFEPRLLALDRVKKMVSVAARKKDLEAEIRDASASVFNSRLSELPDILFVDLALSSAETKRLIKEGGNEEPGPGNIQVLADPRDTLETLAGFRILQAFGRRTPVITTSYARNPLVAQHCMMNGAFGVIRKPVVGHHSEADGEDHRGWDMATAGAMTLGTLEEGDLQNKDPLAVVVGQYLNAAAAEILRAVQSHALCRADGHFPAGLSRGFLGE